MLKKTNWKTMFSEYEIMFDFFINMQFMMMNGFHSIVDYERLISVRDSLFPGFDINERHITWLWI